MVGSGFHNSRLPKVQGRELGDGREAESAGPLPPASSELPIGRNVSVRHMSRPGEQSPNVLWAHPPWGCCCRETHRKHCSAVTITRGNITLTLSARVSWSFAASSPAPDFSPAAQSPHPSLSPPHAARSLLRPVTCLAQCWPGSQLLGNILSQKR